MDDFGLSTKGLVAGTTRVSDVEMGGVLLSEVFANVGTIDAVFTCNDDLALGCLFECQRRGIRVPDDVAIVGFNDLDFCIATVPQLTSVSTERRRMGTWAAEAILEIIRGNGKRPKQTRVDVGWVIMERGSTARAVNKLTQASTGVSPGMAHSDHEPS